MNPPGALLLDTHIALWLDEGSSRLQTSTRQMLEQVRGSGGTVYLSAVSVWELVLLVDCERLRLSLPVADWAARFTDRPGVAALPLTAAAAARAYGFQPFPHRDPADRLLMAAAAETGCRLVTYDEVILDFSARYGGRYHLHALR